MLFIKQSLIQNYVLSVYVSNRCCCLGYVIYFKVQSHFSVESTYVSVRWTFRIRRVRSIYTDIHRYTFLYAEASIVWSYATLFRYASIYMRAVTNKKNRIGIRIQMRFLAEFRTRILLFIKNISNIKSMLI